MKRFSWQELGAYWRDVSFGGAAAGGCSLIDEQCVVRGDVSTDATLRIEGRLEGNVLGGDVIVLGPRAIVLGNITAREVVLGGCVEGNIAATVRVEVEATAQVLGDIDSDAILMHEGASVSGRLRVRPRVARTGGVPAAIAVLPQETRLSVLANEA